MTDKIPAGVCDSRARTARLLGLPDRAGSASGARDAAAILSTEEEVIARGARCDRARGHVLAGQPQGMSALEDLKVVVRTGVGYDVIDIPAATSWCRRGEHPGPLGARGCQPHNGASLAWNRKIIMLDRSVHAGSWSAGIPGA